MDIDLFTFPFYFCAHRGSSLAIELSGIDKVFELADDKTLVIVENQMAELIKGLQVIYGKELKLHIIRDGRQILHGMPGYDEFDEQGCLGFIYPYDTMEARRNLS